MIPPPIPTSFLTGTIQALVGIYQNIAPSRITKDAERRYGEGIELAQKFRRYLTKAELDEISDFEKR